MFSSPHPIITSYLFYERYSSPHLAGGYPTQLLPNRGLQSRTRLPHPIVDAAYSSYFIVLSNDFALHLSSFYRTKCLNNTDLPSTGCQNKPAALNTVARCTLHAARKSNPVSRTQITLRKRDTKLHLRGYTSLEK